LWWERRMEPVEWRLYSGKCKVLGWNSTQLNHQRRELTALGHPLRFLVTLWLLERLVMLNSPVQRTRSCE